MRLRTSENPTAAISDKFLMKILTYVTMPRNPRNSVSEFGVGHVVILFFFSSDILLPSLQTTCPTMSSAGTHTANCFPEMVSPASSIQNNTRSNT